MTCSYCERSAFYLLPAGGGVCRGHRDEAVRAQTAAAWRQDRCRAERVDDTRDRRASRNRRIDIEHALRSFSRPGSDTSFKWDSLHSNAGREPHEIRMATMTVAPILTELEAHAALSSQSANGKLCRITDGGLARSSTASQLAPRAASLFSRSLG